METENPYAAPRTNVGDGLAGSAQPLATRGARFLARFLDGIVETAPIILGAIVTFAMSAGSEQPNITPMILGYIVFFAIWIYQVVILVKTGQTLGKRWAGVKVVRLDGSLATFGSHFLRGLVLGLLGIISILFIFREDRRTVHDLAGETKVVAV